MKREMEKARMSATPYKTVEVLRPGDAQANGMVARLTTDGGLVVHAIAVAQDWPSSTGPTWTYLLDVEGLTLIDAGAPGSFQALADGVKQAGFDVKDIDRVIITHGHRDHDGAAVRLIEEAGAELWAHDIYTHLLPYSRGDLQSNPVPPIQKEMDRVIAENLEGASLPPSRRPSYPDDYEYKKRLEVTHSVEDGDRFTGLEFLHTPGHSPDAICVSLDGLVFTGDHVLPEITPHPTTKVRLATEIKEKLPSRYRDEGKTFGLAAYLRSLNRIDGLGSDVPVLPAHRFHTDGAFNFETANRAGEILRHHAGRLQRVLDRIGRGPTSLEEVTRGIFAHRKLLGGNLGMALSEVVAHIELLQDAGDLDVTDDQGLNWKGTENYRQTIGDTARP